MTLEERERRAYADGRVVEALLLATAIDLQISVDGIEKRLDDAWEEGFKAGRESVDA